MLDRQNTINGWVLFAGIVALGASIVTGEIFHSERPEKMGYPIEGVAVEGEGRRAEQPIAFLPGHGRRCQGRGGLQEVRRLPQRRSGRRHRLGPALFGTMGKPLAAHPGFAYSDALKGVGGTWDWDKMSAWLANPKKFAPGTKMTFAGLSNPQDRADLMLWLNSKGGSLTVPPPPAATATASADKAAAEADDAGAQKAENEPVLNEAQAAKGGRTLQGEAAPGEAPGP